MMTKHRIMEEEFYAMYNSKGRDKHGLEHYVTQDDDVRGDIYLIEVLKGLYLADVDLSYVGFTNPQDHSFDGEVVIIHHFLDGLFSISFKNGLTGYGKGQETMLYAGDGNFEESTTEHQTMKSICITFYVDEFEQELLRLGLLEREEERLAYRNFVERLKKLLVSPTDAQVSKMVADIQESWGWALMAARITSICWASSLVVTSCTGKPCW